MITTRDIKVDLRRERRPLNQKTTKEIDVYVKQGPPKPSKIAVSTHDVEQFAEKTANRKKMEKARAAKGKKTQVFHSPIVSFKEKGKKK